MPADITPANLAMRKAELRLQYMTLAPIPRRRKRTLIKSLVLPILTWCAALAQHADKLLEHLRTACRKAFVGRVLTDTPYPIKCELMGWEHDPKVACLLMSLHFAIRIHVQGTAWLRIVGHAPSKWFHFTSVLTPIPLPRIWIWAPIDDTVGGDLVLVGLIIIFLITSHQIPLNHSKIPLIPIKCPLWAHRGSGDRNCMAWHALRTLAKNLRREKQ